MYNGQLARITAFREIDEYEFLYNILDTIPQLVYVRDRSGKYVYANRASAEFHGLKDKEDLIDRNITDQKIAVRHAIGIMKHDKYVLDHDEINVIPLEAVYDQKGELQWFNTIKTKIHAPNGQDCVLGISTDFNRFQTVIDLATDGVFLISKDKEIAGCNREGAKSLGYLPSDLIGMTITDILVNPTLEKIKPGRPNVVFAKPLNGDPFEVDLNVQRLRDGSFILWAHRVPEKRTEKRLNRLRKTLFDGAFDDHSAPMLLVDAQTKNIVKANKSLLRSYGYKQEDIVGHNIHVLNKDDRKVVDEKISSLNRYPSVNFSTRHEHKDGTIIPVQIYARMIRYEKKNRVFSVVIPLETREKVEQLQNQLERLQRNLVSTIERELQRAADRVLYEEHEWRAIPPQFLSVAKLLGKGFTTKMITEVLPHSESTVKRYKKEIKDILGDEKEPTNEEVAIILSRMKL